MRNKSIRILISMLTAVFLLVNCAVTAYAENGIVNSIKDANTDKGSKTVVGFVDADVVPLDEWADDFGLVGVLADGSLKTAGLPEDLAKELEAWTNIVLFKAYSTLLIGLQQDGRLRIIENSAIEWRPDDYSKTISILKNWTDIVSLAFSTHHIFGLKRDGTLVMSQEDYFGGVENPDFSSWTNLKTIVGGWSEDGGFIVGIRNDGTILEEGLVDRVWYGTPKIVQSVSCSGWQLLCLNGDGTVVSTGLDANPEVLMWKDIVQVCAGDTFAAGLSADGTVKAGTWNEDLTEELSSWTGIKRLYLGDGNTVFGIREDGSVLVSRNQYFYDKDEADELERMAKEVEKWKGIDRILYAARGKVLAVKSDGSLISCGLLVPEISGSDSIPEYVDIVQYNPQSFQYDSTYGFFESPCGYIALRFDGTVRTKGLEPYFDAQTIQAISNWAGLVQVGACAGGIAGLKEDGSVIFAPHKNHSDYSSLPSDYNPGNWKNVEQLVPGVWDFSALSKNGMVLSSSYGEDSLVSTENGQEWTKIKKLLYYAYPESEGLFGLKSDGTVVCTNTYYEFSEEPRNVVDIDSSGYLFACLKDDGSVLVKGVQVADELEEKVAQLHDAVQVTTGIFFVAARKNDGTVAVCTMGDAHVELFSPVNEWKNLIDIQAKGLTLIGLTKDGDVLVVGREDDPGVGGYTAQVKQELRSWSQIVRIKSYYNYVLGWKSDGTIVAAGLDTSWL